MAGILKLFLVLSVLSSTLSDHHPPVSPARNQLLAWSTNQTLYHGWPSAATNLHGNPIPSLSASQAIGTRGHVLLQDHFLIDKLASFNRERIPERVVHAKGAGAHGYFEVTHDISRFTKAKFLNGIGKKTPVFVRFSTSVHSVGSADTDADPHGFAVKLYTEDGNHDLVGNNIEVLAVRDPMLFPDLNRSRKRNPVTNMRDPNMWWDFVTQRPETTLHTLHLFSDIGRPDGFRRMDGFGVHAFKLVNSKGQVVFAKFHWKTRQQKKFLTAQQAQALMATNTEYKTQDLYDAIKRGDYPSWDLNIQVMTVEQAKKHPYNPFDITRVWRQEEYPLIPVGRLTLNRNPSNFFAEVEQAAFLPSNMVPGIEASPDRMLAARLFAYQDAQRYRLGVNSAQLPINRPLSEVNSYQRDGKACYGPNGGGSPNYFPNSFGGSIASSEASQVVFSVAGLVDRFDVPEDEHVFARMFVEKDIGDEERQRLCDGIADRLKEASPELRERALKVNFYPVSKKFGDQVKKALEAALASQSHEHGIGSKHKVYY